MHSYLLKYIIIKWIRTLILMTTGAANGITLINTHWTQCSWANKNNRFCWGGAYGQLWDLSKLVSKGFYKAGHQVIICFHTFGPHLVTHRHTSSMHCALTGSPWENGYNERFNGTLRKEVLNTEWFHTKRQAQVAINVWLRKYNQIRPRHALNMRTPAPETLLEKPKINGRI